MDDFSAHAAKATGRLRDDPRLAEVGFTIEQRIVDDAGNTSIYHVVIADGKVAVNEGPAQAPDLRIEQDDATALLLRSGELSTQTAFLTGRLTIEGDIQLLLEHGSVLAELFGELGA